MFWLVFWTVLFLILLKSALFEDPMCIEIWNLWTSLNQIKSLEKDMASIKSGSLSASGNDVGDLVRLKAEVERLEVSTQETLLAQQAKHNLEVSSLKEQLEDSGMNFKKYFRPVGKVLESRNWFLVSRNPCSWWLGEN